MKNKKDIDFELSRKEGATATDAAVRKRILEKLNYSIYGAVGLDINNVGMDALLRLVLAGVASAGVDVSSGAWYCLSSHKEKDGKTVNAVGVDTVMVYTNDDSMFLVSVVSKHGVVERVTYLWVVESPEKVPLATVIADTPTEAAREARKQFGWTAKTYRVYDKKGDGDIDRKVVLKG